MDGAKLAILPFLRSRGWQAVDLVMVSHSDIDHAGGLARLLQEHKVNEVVSGQPQKVSQVAQLNPLQQPVAGCYAGQDWQWDGVRFDVLWPLRNASEADTDNDASCVLKACAAEQCVLITGDLSERGEKRLLQQAAAESVRAELLIAGHHGSRYSSSASWLAAVQPKVVLFSSGYHNRFHFPNRETLQRLPPSVNWYNTACSGGIGFTLGGDEFVRRADYEVRKRRQKWYHHRCLEAEQGVLYQ
ncbi:ComEC/Rec2 family competence protein [Thiomicrorhabdus cannonii]|uniref:ComEC/Rec2 family competence protein n=1 Tax=Thiomicrorhabdus cannonii TaxID=2748011 RepID=UPI0015B903D9|nr:MBL fold metallo-hydrolase [Thiomicrorhabdus cannonii]